MHEPSKAWEDFTNDELNAYIRTLEASLTHAKNEIVRRMINKIQVPGWKPWAIKDNR